MHSLLVRRMWRFWNCGDVIIISGGGRCIVDLIGKHHRVRTIPMPTWVKLAIDAWATNAGVANGFTFRPVNRGDRISGNGVSEKIIWQLLRPYAAAVGVAGIAPP